MKTKLVKKMFVVCMSIALAVSPITANAATKNLRDKDRILYAPSVGCSVETNSTNKENWLNNSSTLAAKRAAKKTLVYHVKLDSSYKFTGYAKATVTGYCTDKKSGAKVAANFKTTFVFSGNGMDDMILKDVEAKSSKSKNAVVSEGYGGETWGTVMNINTSTVCSKTSYETKILTRSSSRPK